MTDNKVVKTKQKKVNFFPFGSSDNKSKKSKQNKKNVWLFQLNQRKNVEHN